VLAVVALSAPVIASEMDVAVTEAAEHEIDVVAQDEDLDVEEDEEESADEETDEAADEEEDSDEEAEEADEESTEEFVEVEVTPSGTCLKNFSGAKLAAAAAKFQAAYKAAGVTYSQPHRSFGLKPSTKQADCSSFVTSVLDSLGYDCLFASGRNTHSMKTLMADRGGFHQKPLIGAILMWEDHTGIVGPKQCPAGQAQLIAMGVHGCAASACMTPAAMHAWGSGGWLGFWTPRS